MMFIFCGYLLYRNKNVFEFSPVFIYMVEWFFFLIGAFVFIFGWEWNKEGIVFILLTIVLLMLGYLIVSKFVAKSSVDFKLDVNTNIKLRRISYIISIYLGVLGVVSFLLTNGITFKMIITDFLGVNSILAKLRYSESEEHLLFVQILMVFVSFAPFIGGIELGFGNFRLRFSLLSLFPSLFYMLVSNIKLVFLVSCFIFFSAWNTGYFLKNGKFLEIRKKQFLYAVIIILLVILLLFLSLLFRSGLSSFTYIFDKLIVYAFGHVPAFDYWFTFDCIPTSDHFGEYTFISIYNMLGLSSRLQGIYQEFIVINSASDTNVYSYFRGLVSDFGVYGSLLLFFICGCILAFCERPLKTRSRRGIRVYLICVATFIFIFTLFVLDFIVSVFSYTTYVVCICFVILYLFCFIGKINVAGVEDGKK